MVETTAARPSALYWVVSIALLLWALGGASIYAAYFVETPAEFAATAETAANRQAYGDYVSRIPAWAVGAGIAAAAARLVGAIGLLLRKAWALPLYVASLAFFLVALYRAFVLANVSAVMSRAHIGVELAFLALSLFAIGFSRRSKSRGLLT